MRLIGRNEILFERLNSNLQIISSLIKGFNIFLTDDGLVIEVDFELLYEPASGLKLRFLGVKEYSFYWNYNHNFYYIENYKLTKKENLFYVSFDPEIDSSLDISINDQDFILFTGFEGYYTDS